MFSTLVLFQIFGAIVVMSSSIFEMDIVRFWFIDCCFTLTLISVSFKMFAHIDFDFYGVLIGVIVSSANLFVFCYCGELTTNTFLRYTDSLYESNWYSLPTHLQKYYILMISSTQKQLLYEGHGMTTLNCLTFLKV